MVFRAWGGHILLLMQRGSGLRSIAISLRGTVQFLGVEFAALHYKWPPEGMTQLAGEMSAP
jgi:hypothetical protein